jgi:hypothetical protein
MTVALLGAIHQQWAASPGLAGLLPAARLSTGASPNPSLPRAVLTRQSEQPLAACNDGSAVASVGVQVEVFHLSYDAAATIVDQVTKVFDRADFPLDDGPPEGARVICMRRTNHSEGQEADGTWRMTVDFACAVYRPAGDPQAP